MPCYEKVVVEVDLKIKDQAALDSTLERLGGRRISATRFTLGGIEFSIRGETVEASSQGADADYVNKMIDQLRKRYVTESLKNWGKANKMTVNETADGKLKMRRWV